MSQTFDPGKLIVSNRLKTVSAIFTFLGLAAFIVTLMNNSERAWHAYLIGFFYFVSIAVGGLFFTSIQHVTKAGWSVNVRRLCESFTSFLPFAFLAGLALVFGGPDLFDWLKPEVVAKDHLLQHKAPYLNAPFFWIRYVVFFAIWIGFTRLIVKPSLDQDQSGDVSITHKILPASVIFVMLFALSYTFFSFDTLMSLEAHWFSTIFGVYLFSGLFQTTMASMILLIIYLNKKGLLKGFVNSNHMHDLGKFLFAFTVFWAYIAFSQYMLIWYANLPEETLFFEPRSHGSWLYVSVALIIFKFIVPFIALLPRWAKRTPAHLAAVSILLLVMQFVDLYWLVYPNLNEEHTVFGFSEVLIFLGFLGVFLFTVTRFLSRHSVVPYKDPRIHESMHHHVVY